MSDEAKRDRRFREVTGYVAAHMRTVRLRGRAKNYQCVFCGEGAFDWALDHRLPNLAIHADTRGRFSYSPADYIPLCRPCHIVFDSRQITHCPAGHPYAGNNLIQKPGSNERRCRTCKAVWQNRYHARVKAQRAAQRNEQAA